MSKSPNFWRAGFIISQNKFLWISFNLPIFLQRLNAIIHWRRDRQRAPSHSTWQLVPINSSKMRRNARVLCGRYRSFRVGTSESNRRLKANHTRGSSDLAPSFSLFLWYSSFVSSLYSVYPPACVPRVCMRISLARQYDAWQCTLMPRRGLLSGWLD